MTIVAFKAVSLPFLAASSRVNFTDISIVYYYDSSTLEITFKINYGNDYVSIINFKSYF